MLREEIETLSAFFDENWPGKFTTHDVAEWARELQQYDIDEIRSACVHFKQDSRFKPYLREIRPILDRMFPGKRAVVAAPRSPSRFKSVIAQQWAQSRPNEANDPEAVLILRYYRYWFCRKRKDIHDVAATRDKPMPDDAERIAVTLKASVNACRSDLVGATGMSYQQAENAARWIDATQAEFESMLDSLSAVPVGAAGEGNW